MAKSTEIVYYEPVCGMATLFKSEEKAIAAAKEESKERGYECEVVRCDKEHGLKNGKYSGPGWHVRGVNFH